MKSGHHKLSECQRAAQKMTAQQALHLLNNYVPVHSMREHVGWWSQAGETHFKRQLGVRAGIIDLRPKRSKQ